MQYPQLFEIAHALAPITETEWEEFAGTFIPGTADKGEILQRPGDVPRYIWVILRGVVRNYDLDDKGKEYTKVFRGPGELIGPYPELLARTKTRFFIQSITEATFLRFPYAKFEEMMDKSKAWERLGRLLAQNNFLEKEKREYDLMHLSAEQRYQEFTKQYGELLQSIPQYQVASSLAISPEALNRLIKAKKQ
jgi:CRP-like cAMP-binding protein